MAGKKSAVSPFVEAAKELLSQEGIPFKEWTNDHLRDKKMAILEGKECESYVLSKINTLVSDKNQVKNGGNKHVNETTTSTANTTNE